MAEAALKRRRFENLRQRVFDHIDTRKPFARPRKMVVGLRSAHAPGWDAEWRETMILFNCHRRAKPARMHGQLSTLQSYYQKRDEPEKFDELMEKVKNVLYPDFITPHGYKRTFSQLDKEGIFNSLSGSLSPLASLGYPIFLYAGALLGHVRDGNLIDHDDDIDIAVMLGECTATEAAQKWLAFKFQLADAGFVSSAEKERNGLSFVIETGLPIQVDIFPAWTEGGRFSVYPYSCGELNASDIFPLMSFERDPLMLPADPVALLAQSYGAGWRTPDPLFHLDWPAKKLLFKELSAVDYRLA